MNKTSSMLNEFVERHAPSPRVTEVMIISSFVLAAFIGGLFIGMSTLQTKSVIDNQKAQAVMQEKIDAINLRLDELNEEYYEKKGNKES